MAYATCPSFEYLDSWNKDLLREPKREVSEAEMIALKALSNKGNIEAQVTLSTIKDEAYKKFALSLFYKE